METEPTLAERAVIRAILLVLGGVGIAAYVLAIFGALWLTWRAIRSIF